MSQKGIDEVQMILDEALNLFKEKDLVYGDTWIEEGILGNYIDVQRKWLRLKNMIEPYLGNIDSTIAEISEKQKLEVEDKFIDLINRSAQTLFLIRAAWATAEAKGDVYDN